MLSRNCLKNCALLAACAVVLSAGGMPEDEAESDSAFGSASVVEELSTRFRAQQRRQIRESDLAEPKRVQEPERVAEQKPVPPSQNPEARASINPSAVEALSNRSVSSALAHQLNLHGFNADWKSDHVVLTIATDNVIDYESDELTAQGKEDLDEIGKVLQGFSIERMLVEGHTDSWGDIETNVLASTSRADLLAFTLSMSGIPKSRINTAGRGEAFPIASNNSLEGRSKNRRIEVLIW